MGRSCPTTLSLCASRPNPPLSAIVVGHHQVHHQMMDPQWVRLMALWSSRSLTNHWQIKISMAKYIRSIECVNWITYTIRKYKNISFEAKIKAVLQLRMLWWTRASVHELYLGLWKSSSSSSPSTTSTSTSTSSSSSSSPARCAPLKLCSFAFYFCPGGCRRTSSVTNKKLSDC